MYFLYILRSVRSGRTYTGITNNITRRLNEHNSGKHSYTKRYMPWEVIYTESFPTRENARKKEKYFKSASGRRLIKELLKDIK